MSTFFGGNVIGVGEKRPAALMELADVCDGIMARRDALQKSVETYGKSVEEWIKQGPQRASTQEMKLRLQIDARTFYWVAFHIYVNGQDQDGMVKWDESTIAQQKNIVTDQQFAAGHLTELSLGMGMDPVLNDFEDELVWLDLFDTALKSHTVSLLLFSRKIYDRYVMSRPGFFQELFRSFGAVSRYNRIPWYHTYEEFVHLLECIVAVDPEAVKLVPDAVHQTSGQIFKLYPPRWASKNRNPDPEILKRFAYINPEVLKVNVPAMSRAIHNFEWMKAILLSQPEAVQWIQNRVKPLFLERMMRAIPAISNHLNQSVLDRIKATSNAHAVIEHV